MIFAVLGRGGGRHVTRRMDPGCTHRDVCPFGWARLRHVVVAVGLASLIGLYGGCAWDGSEGRDQPDGHGPLVALIDGGGNSVHRPERAAAVWQVTFGSLLLCSSETVTISRVEPRFKYGRPVSVEFLLRTVPGVTGRNPGRQLSWAPVAAATKSPMRMAESGALRYASLGPALGAEINQPCAEGADVPFTEIVTALDVDWGGVWIDGVDIHYVAEGESYSLFVNWAYVACGDLVDHTDVC